MSYRNNILDRLQQFRGQFRNPNEATNLAYSATTTAAGQGQSTQFKSDQFVEAMTAAHGEVIKTTSALWQQDLFQHLQNNAITNLMVATQGRYGDLLEVSDCPAELVPYDQKIEALKDTLFHHTQAGLSGAFAGIAETGTLLVSTGPGEPRTLSLVPPVNYVVLEAATLFWDQREAFSTLEKELPLPTNLLLISGPSKTADIQQTLAYGAHGPKRLIVLLIED